MTARDSSPAPPLVQPNQHATIASVLMFLQAAILGLAGLFLCAWGGDGRRRFVHRFLYARMATHPIRWGLVLIIFSAALVVIAIALAHRRSWAPPATYVIEAIVGLGALLRFHPIRSVLGLGLAVAVILLVATDAPAQTARAGTTVNGGGSDSDLQP